MLNLNELKTKNYRFVYFDGSEIELKKPSQALLEKAVELSKLSTNDFGALMNIIYDVLYEILNSNLAKREFTMEEIKENFDIEVAYIFLEDYMGSIIPEVKK